MDSFEVSAAERNYTLGARNHMRLKFRRSKERVGDLRAKAGKAANDTDGRRTHAHRLIDARLEDGEITWWEAAEMKRGWDKRHGYS